MVCERQIIIMDNGAYSIKAGRASDEHPRCARTPLAHVHGVCRVVPNAIMKSKSERKRVFVAGELDECVDRSALYYQLPMQRGYLSMRAHIRWRPYARSQFRH
jgi:actin-related protein 6